MENAANSIFLVMDRHGEPLGAGFLVAPGLGVTCASIVRLEQGEPRIGWIGSLEAPVAAAVASEYAACARPRNLAFLRLPKTPEGLQVAPLGRAEGSQKHRYETIGIFGGGVTITSSRTICHVPPGDSRARLLKLSAQDANLTVGTPVWLYSTQRVIGMVAEFPRDEPDYAYAIPAEQIAACCPLLQLQPPQPAAMGFPWESTIVITDDAQAGAAASPPKRKLAALHQALVASFDLEELRTLCFLLETEYEDIPGSTRSEFAREMLRHFDRAGRLEELIALCQQQRPSRPW